jgi:Tfp pilus assembly protein PilO
MGTGRANQLWVAGGAVIAAALFTIAWFLFISARNSEASSLRDQTGTAQDQLAPQQRRLAQLRQQNANLPTYQAELASNRQALPTSPAMPDLLRNLQVGGDQIAGVSVTGVSVHPSEKVTAAGKPVTQVPMSVTVGGTLERINGFLVQLQTVRPRAVFIKNTNLAADPTTGYTMTIDMNVYVGAAG